MDLTAKTKGVKEEVFAKLQEPKNILQNWKSQELGQLDGSLYYKISNVMAKDHCEKWIKIDKLILSDFGIYVINFIRKKGIIYGCDEDDCWINNHNGRVDEFPNPIYQNRRGINALKNLLIEYPHIHYHSMIAFLNKTELYIEAKTNTEICHVKNLVGIIRKTIEFNIAPEEKNRIYKKIRKQTTKYKIERQKIIEALIHRNRKRMLREIIKKSIKTE
ncbi:MAG: NERD domain-containing protein [Clostridia bacterium]|nr:NERD domain-containing protein [Clostridia bacterium]